MNSNILLEKKASAASKQRSLCSRVGLLGILWIGFLGSCDSKSNPVSSSSPSVPVTSAQKGRLIYQTQCIACHHSNPRKAGALGPEVQGASRELLEARVLRATYPPGYQPKRATHSMVPMPHLKNDIDALYDYLNSLQ